MLRRLIGLLWSEAGRQGEGVHSIDEAAAASAKALISSSSSSRRALLPAVFFL